MVKGKKLTKKDRKHLNDFGEIHPADLESERMKNEIKEKKLDGTYKEKFIILTKGFYISDLKLVRSLASFGVIVNLET